MKYPTILASGALAAGINCSSQAKPEIAHAHQPLNCPETAQIKHETKKTKTDLLRAVLEKGSDALAKVEAKIITQDDMEAFNQCMEQPEIVQCSRTYLIKLGAILMDLKTEDCQEIYRSFHMTLRSKAKKILECTQHNDEVMIKIFEEKGTIDEAIKIFEASNECTQKLLTCLENAANSQPLETLMDTKSSCPNGSTSL